MFAARDVDNVSELILDRLRLRRDGVLSVAYQEPSEADAPSAFRVADFRVRPGGRDRPKDTRPQPSPVPYAGSAQFFPHATASSSQPGFPPDAAVDGDAASFWVSGGSAPGQGPTPERPETLTVELGTARDIATVTVTPRVNYGPRTFAIEARSGGEWRRLAEVEQANAAATHAVARTRSGRRPARDHRRVRHAAGAAQRPGGGDRRRRRAMSARAFAVAAVLLALAALPAAASAKPALRVTDLRVGHMTNPLGIDDTTPTLSWKLRSRRDGEYQHAYRVQAWNERGRVWDSGRVRSDASTGVPYDGPPLRSRDRLRWSVRVWGRHGTSDWSRPARFEIGLLRRSDWRARWVADPATTRRNADPLDDPLPGARRRGTCGST